jgi:cyanophycinase-like exopeptidase
MSTLYRLRGGGWFDEPTEALGDLMDVVNRFTNPVVGIIASPLDGDKSCDEQDKLAEKLAAEGIHSRTLTQSNRDWPNLDDAKSFARECNVLAMLGGNVAETRLRWRLHGIDAVIKAALTSSDRAMAVVGSSLGSGNWFRYICTRDRLLKQPKSDNSRWIPGLGILPARIALHYNERHLAIPRATAFLDLLGSEPIDTVGIGIDPQLAIEVDDDIVRIVDTDRYAAVDRLVRVAPGKADGTTQRTGLNGKSYKRGEEIPFKEFFLPTAA